MISLSTQPGRLTVRTRTVPTWLVAALAALHVPIFALLFVLASRATRVATLECDRGTGQCVRTSDGRPVDRIALDRVTGAGWRVDRSMKSVSLLLTTRGGDAWIAVRGERRARAERDVAAIESFLAGRGGDRLALRWDHGPLLITALVGIPFAMLVGLLLFALPIRCTADRVARTVAVGWIRTRVHRLDAFCAVRAQTGTEQAEERIRRAVERTGREPWYLALPRDPRAAAARRVVLERADGGVLPVTAWLVGREDPAPIVDALRTFLAS